MTDNPTGPDLDALAALEKAATPAPWEPGDPWLTAGLIYDDDGERIGAGRSATRCAYCHHGDPVWSGRRDINGRVMAAHIHRSPEAWRPEHYIAGPPGVLVAANFDYEMGGIISPEDTALIVAMRNQLPALLDRLARYEGAITWGTSCLSCSKVLDGAYQETVRAEQAEADRDAARADAQQAHAVVEAAQAAVANLLDLHPNIRDAKPGWFHESTLRLVAAVDALATPAVAPQADEEPVLCGAANPFYPTITCDSVKDHPNLTLGLEVFNHANMRRLCWWNDGDLARMVVRDELLTDTPSLVAEIRHRQAYEPPPAAAPAPAPHCGLCRSEDCPGTPGKGCMPGPYETYEPVPVDTGNDERAPV